MNREVHVRFWESAGLKCPAPLAFAGREPELVMEAALSGRRWTKGSVGFDQTFIDARGNEFVAQAASIQITPKAAMSGQTIEAELQLRGAKSAARASDLAPIIADLESTGASSLREIAAGLNERGIPTARGGLWSAVQVQRVMNRAGPM